MPDLPRPAIPRLGSARPGGQAPRRSSRDPRRHRAPHPRATHHPLRSTGPMSANESPMPSPATLTRRLVAEFIGTGLLVAIVVGSGIAAARLSPEDVGLQLLENSLATTLGLAVLIAVL